MFGSPSGLEALLHRPRRTAWQHFRSAPLVFLASKLYSLRCVIPASAHEKPVSVVCISDTHNQQPQLPSGDVLIHAGDLTQSGSYGELQAALSWISKQPFQHKIVIAGNHDLILDPSQGLSQRDQLDWGDIVYLQDSEEIITCENGRRLRVYGSPKTPQHGNWAFQYPPSQDVWENTMPNNIDILVTHGPPRYHLDLLNLGCCHLLRELWHVHPRLHVFGHVHEGYGTAWLAFDELQAAFERLVTAKGGFGHFFILCKEFLLSRLGPARQSVTVLVNPAIVGGLRDNERREPIKVII